MRPLAIFACVCTGVSVAAAQGMDNSMGEGKDLAGEKQGAVEHAPLNPDSVYNVPGYQDQDWGSFDDAEDFLDGAANELAENPNASFVVNSHLHRPGINVSRDDSFMQRGFEILRGPNDDTLDGLTAEYGDCKPVEQPAPAGDVVYGMQCDRSRPLQDESCRQVQNVTVDADYNYDCDRVRRKQNRTCDEWLEVTASSTFKCGGYHGTRPEGEIMNSLSYQVPEGFLLRCNATGTSASLEFYRATKQRPQLWHDPDQLVWKMTVDPFKPFNVTGREGADTYSTCDSTGCNWVITDGSRSRTERVEKVEEVEVHESWKNNCAALEAIAR